MSKNKNDLENELTDVSLGEVILRRLDLAEEELAIEDEVPDTPSTEQANVVEDMPIVTTEGASLSESISDIEPVDANLDESAAVDPTETVSIDMAPEAIEDLPGESVELATADESPALAQDFLVESEQPAVTDEAPSFVDEAAEPVPVELALAEALIPAEIEPVVQLEAEPVVQAAVQPVAQAPAQVVSETLPEPVQDLAQTAVAMPVQEPSIPVVMTDDALRQMFRNAADEVNGNNK